MAIEDLEYPKRKREHAVGDRALEIFKVRLPREWTKDEFKKDYGWDIWLTIARDEQTREIFFAQLKGSDKPNYTENDTKVSVSLKVSTVNWLLNMVVPVMLCICDTGNSEEPLYYVWLSEELNRIAKENPDWRKQETIVFHIPVSQALDKNNIDEIQRYVEKFYRDLKISAAIGNVLGSSLGFQKSIPVAAFTEGAVNIVSERVSSMMGETGIIDVIKDKDEPSIEPFSEKDQKRFKEINKST